MPYLKNEGPAKPISQNELPYFLTPMYLSLIVKIPKRVTHAIRDINGRQEDNTED